jgi:hypothetical protein
MVRYPVWSGVEQDVHIGVPRWLFRSSLEQIGRHLASTCKPHRNGPRSVCRNESLLSLDDSQAALALTGTIWVNFFGDLLDCSPGLDFGAQLRQFSRSIIWRCRAVGLGLTNQIGEPLVFRRQLRKLIVLLSQQGFVFAEFGLGAALNQQRCHDGAHDDDARENDFEFCHGRLIDCVPLHADHNASVLGQFCFRR